MLFFYFIKLIDTSQQVFTGILAQENHDTFFVALHVFHRFQSRKHLKYLRYQT